MSAPAPSHASVSAIQSALDSATKPRGYKCLPVAWNDVQRGWNSSGGTNITDSRLVDEALKPLYTLRKENFNEHVGRISTDEVAAQVGNHLPESKELEAVTLQTILRNLKKYGSYAGVDVESLDAPQLDSKASVRFDVVFLPAHAKTRSGEDTFSSSVNFLTQTHNYQTRSYSDPKNLLLLLTSQGTSIQTDGPGYQKIALHSVAKDGRVHRYWLEAESSKDHGVGGAQVEVSEAAAAAAAARGKATSRHIGIRAMGTRFNVQVVVQVPLKQNQAVRLHFGGIAPEKSYSYGAPPPTSVVPIDLFGLDTLGGGGFSFGASKPAAAPTTGCTLFGGGVSGGSSFGFGGSTKGVSFGFGDEKFAAVSAAPPAYDSLLDLDKAQPMCDEGPSGDDECDSDSDDDVDFEEKEKKCKRLPKKSVAVMMGARAAPSKGTSHAARVSRGKELDVWSGVKMINKMERDTTQHITMTVTMYYVVEGGVPTPEDALRAIDDCEALYRACNSNGRLFSDANADLTHKPPVVAPAPLDAAFPVSETEKAAAADVPGGAAVPAVSDAVMSDDNAAQV